MPGDGHKDKLRGEPTRRDRVKSNKVSTEDRDEVYDATKREMDLKTHLRAAGRDPERFRGTSRKARLEAEEIVKKARGNKNGN